ncbi:M48 family metalloprotease [uncultured Ruminococcus sp.]|uniref:M48 family metalloprotease n=1 Tax=uncultured Ruminococcus sp. TaxID=165186 RepID=UPI0025FD4BF4|nr:M48 family metalloprotease [uncultured Ruminococcus sp.]
MSDKNEKVNPLLQIDTGFRSYLNAYTRSYQNHMIDGSLDYAFESDFAVRQKIMSLGGSAKLFKAVNTQDIAAEAKHLFMKCDQVGPLKYPEIYDKAKKCAERLELIVPIVFIREDMDRPLAYSISNDLIEPCIVLTKQLLDFCSDDELMLLIGCECGRVQNNHCTFNMAYTYLNVNNEVFRPNEKFFSQTIGSQLYSALVQWVKYADVTANRAGMMCLDKPGQYLNIMCGLYKKGYVDFYGRSQRGIDFDELCKLSAQIHESTSRNLSISAELSALERSLLASNEFLYCKTLYSWRQDVKDIEGHAESGQICDVRTSVIVGNGGQK